MRWEKQTHANRVTWVNESDCINFLCFFFHHVHQGRESWGRKKVNHGPKGNQLLEVQLLCPVRIFASILAWLFFFLPLASLLHHFLLDDQLNHVIRLPKRTHFTSGECVLLWLLWYTLHYRLIIDSCHLNTSSERERERVKRFFVSIVSHHLASRRHGQRAMQVHFPMKLLASLCSGSFFSLPPPLSSCFCMTRKTLLAFTLLQALRTSDKLSQVSRCLLNVYCCLKRWRKKEPPIEWTLAPEGGGGDCFAGEDRMFTNAV